jgi:transcriptional regulator with XRE-family HTH domain
MFPERLTKLREEKKLSKTYMGKLVGVTRQAYAKYEEGKSEPDIKTINKFASFFGVTADFLLGNTDDPNGTTDTQNEEINTAFHDFDNLTDEEKEHLELQLQIYRELKKRKEEKERNREK